MVSRLLGSILLAYSLMNCPVAAASCFERLLNQFSGLRSRAIVAETQARQLEEINGLIPEYLRLARLNDLRIEENFCRGGSALWQRLLEARGYVVEAVKNRGHTFIRVPNFYGAGQHLYVDGTIRQFFRPRWRAPRVFVGTEEDLMQLMRGSFVGDQNLRDWMVLQPDNVGPGSVSINLGS